MTTYNVGVIGCGAIATERHLPCLAQHQRVDLHSVYDHHIENIRSVTVDYEVHAHDSLTAFLDEPLDLVTITTPPSTHSELTKSVLEADINVLCEKPMAVSVSEAEQMETLATESNATLGIVHNFLYSNSLRTATRLLQQGDIGDVKYVKGFQISSAQRDLPTWYPDLPGGLFFDEVPHLLYLIEHFIGHLTLTSATGEIEPNARQSLQSVSAGFEGSAGHPGSITMIFDAPLSEWFLLVVGTKRVLVVDIFRDILLWFGREKTHSPSEVLTVVLQTTAQEVIGLVKSGIRVLRGNMFFGLDELVTRYIYALETGRPPPVTPADGRRVIELAYEVTDGCGIHHSE